MAFLAHQGSRRLDELEQVQKRGWEREDTKALSVDEAVGTQEEATQGV